MSFPGAEIKFTPKITVVSVTNSASGQSTHQLQEGCKAFTVICNEFELIRVAWETGQVGSASGNWFILYPRESYTVNGLHIAPDNHDTLYMNAPSASAAVDVAVIEWL